MTTLAQLRKTAISLSETTEQRIDSGEVVFAVRDKRFASAEHGVVRLHLPAADADEILSTYPTAGRLTRGATAIGVRIPLADINGQQLNHWVRRAWLSRAPKQLAAQAAAAATAVAGEVGDLPRAIGRPATQALTSVGITTLDQVAEHTEAALSEMHGIGPKVIRILNETLVAAGRPQLRGH